MVYMFGVSPIMATSYSLFVVGTTSLVGAAQQYRKGAVNIKMGFLFATTSVFTVFLTRKWLVPLIPAEIMTIHGFIITESWLTMVLFAILMILSAIFMLRRRTVVIEGVIQGQPLSIVKLVLFGTSIGLITGLLGAGGGFLLIPALVLLLRLPMKEAVGTSLFVIALNSLIGFTGNMQDRGINWWLLIITSVLAIAGIVAGSYLNTRIPSEKLKKAFGWFVLAMGAFILAKETGLI